MPEIEPIAYNCGDDVNSTTSFEVADTNTATLNETRSTENTPTIIASDITVYPNPTKGLLNLNINNLMGKEALLTMYTLNGKKILSQKLNTGNPKVQLDLSNYQDGIYTLFLYIENEGVFCKKVVTLK